MIAAITAEMAAIKKACFHSWKPWLGKAAYCTKCGHLCHFMPKSRKRKARAQQRSIGAGIAMALKITRAHVEGMLR